MERGQQERRCVSSLFGVRGGYSILSKQFFQQGPEPKHSLCSVNAVLCPEKAISRLFLKRKVKGTSGRQSPRRSLIVKRKQVADDANRKTVVFSARNVAKNRRARQHSSKAIIKQGRLDDDKGKTNLTNAKARAIQSVCLPIINYIIHRSGRNQTFTASKKDPCN